MTTFQAMIYAAIHGISEFLPISSSGHRILVPYLVGWQPPTGALLAAMTLGAFMALLIYFRHDLASMISCVLQVIIFRKRPMTLDERLPLFLGVSCLPVVLATYYFRTRVSETEWTPLLVAGIVASASIPLWAVDYLCRKFKGMFDWKWFDAAVIGLVQATAVIPGWDHFTAVLLGALFLNYKREPAAKYAYFALVPITLSHVISEFKEVSFVTSAPSPDLSWLSFGVAVIVSTLAGLLAIGGFLRHVQTKGIGQYLSYRWILAGGVCAAYWIRSHS
jgi:undecaprenyl-diphosphatase